MPGLEIEVERFPEGTRTADDAARAVGCEVGQIVKSLVFMADDRPVHRARLGRQPGRPGELAAAIGAARARRADGDEARAATGFAIGGVPPFGHAPRTPVVVDRDLLAHEVGVGRRRAAGRGLRDQPGALVRASAERRRRRGRSTSADVAGRADPCRRMPRLRDHRRRRAPPRLAGLASRCAGRGAARRWPGAWPGRARSRSGSSLGAGRLPGRPVRVAGRIRCRDPLETGDGERLVAFHRDVEVLAGGRWRSIERLRETRSFELWDHDGSLTLDPAAGRRAARRHPAGLARRPDELEEPHASAVATARRAARRRDRGARHHPDASTSPIGCSCWRGPAAATPAGSASSPRTAATSSRTWRSTTRCACSAGRSRHAGRRSASSALAIGLVARCHRRHRSASWRPVLLTRRRSGADRYQRGIAPAHIPFLASGARFLPEAPFGPWSAAGDRGERSVNAATTPRRALLSVAQAATLLGVHPNTIRTWTDAGRLTAYRINSRGDRRFRRGDVERLLVEDARHRRRRAPPGRPASAVASWPSSAASRGLAASPTRRRWPAPSSRRCAPSSASSARRSTSATTSAFELTAHAGFDAAAARDARRPTPSRWRGSRSPLATRRGPVGLLVLDAAVGRAHSAIVPPLAGRDGGHRPRRARGCWAAPVASSGARGRCAPSPRS